MSSPNKMKPRILQREITYTGYLTIERLRLRLADGAEAFREVESHGNAAAVLPYDAERRCALVVRLFRAPVLVAAGGFISEEACAGMIGFEGAPATARREANSSGWRRPWCEGGARAKRRARRRRVQRVTVGGH